MVFNYLINGDTGIASRGGVSRDLGGILGGRGDLGLVESGGNTNLANWFKM